jgi:hypothetical protein
MGLGNDSWQFTMAFPHARGLFKKESEYANRRQVSQVKG